MKKRYTFRFIAVAYYAFLIGTVIADIGEPTAAVTITTFGAVKVIMVLACIALLAYWAGQESRTDYINR